MSEATSRFDWLHPRGYFAKFVLSFIGLVVFVLLVNGGLETWFMYRETTQLVVKSEGEKAEATARRVEQFLSETERQISWATRASTTTVEQRHQDYQLLLQQVPAIERAIYLDSGGREQVRLTRQTFVAGSNLDYSGDPRFKEAQGKPVWWSQVYFNGREPFMAVSVAHSGRNAGSTVAEISLKFLSDYIERTQIGQDTEAFVVDRLGRLLAHSDSNAALGSNYSSLPQVASLLNNAATPMMGTDPDGTRVLTASATIRQHDWYVFFGQPVNTALRPVYNLVFRTGWLLLLGIGLSILAGMLLAQRLVTPIKALQVGARQLEASNFGHRIEVRSRDEMGELADQFNRMADELQGSYGRLEQKVEERTRDLAKSNSELKALEEIGRAVASSLDTMSVLGTVVKRATELVHASAGAIYTYDHAQGQFELAGSEGLGADLLISVGTARVRLDEGSLGTRMDRQPISIADLSSRPDFPNQAAIVRAGFNSALVIPLVGQDALLGALVLFRRETGAFPGAGFMQTFADQSVLALNNARLFREVEQKGRELAVASEHKSQFLANMSHELRTPLNAVLGYAELLSDGLYGQMPEKATEVLERIQHNGKHLLGLINDVLDISKIEAGQLNLALEDYSVESVVQSVISAAGSLAKTKGIELRSEVPPQLPLGRGDERRLTQVLLNLVSNAIKFTDAGAVDVSVKLHEDKFSISVTDTGPGIAIEDQSKIFDEFQQVDNSSTRKKGGSGLGLSISRRLVDLHGGRIDLDSTVGVGSTFSIVVPVRVNHQRPAA